MLFPSYTTTFLSVVAGLLLPVSHAIPPGIYVNTTTVTAAGAPASCTTTFVDFAHSTVWTGTHMCHTHTVTTADAACPPLACPAPPTDLICPMYIKVSSTTVPCATDCCPATPTAYVPSVGPLACPKCDACRIPTEWITYTTGCAGTPTITAQTIVTPPY